MTHKNLFQITQSLTAAERREVLARLLAEQNEREVGTVWKIIRFDEKLRVVAYTLQQEKYLETLSDTLRRGTLARIENVTDGTFEIFGAERTFYVTMSEKKQFVGLLDSWLPGNPPREIAIREN